VIFQTLEAGCLSAAALAKAEALKTGAAGSKGWNFLEASVEFAGVWYCFAVVRYRNLKPLLP